MANDTAFPGIKIQEIETAGFDGGFEPDEPVPQEEVDLKPFKDEFEVTYDLVVKAVHPRMAKSKARAFVRAKNPFEPDFITFAKRTPLVSGNSTVMKEYLVSVLISK